MNKQVKYLARVELLRLLQDKAYGFMLTYDDLKLILDRDPQGPGRADILWVRARLLRERQKWLENKVGEGYFIAHPPGHAGAAQRYDDQAHRKLKLALDITINTDIENLKPDELRLHREIQHKQAIKYLISEKTNRAKPREIDSVSMPSGHDLAEIYRTKRT